MLCVVPFAAVITALVTWRMLSGIPAGGDSSDCSIFDQDARTTSGTLRQDILSFHQQACEVCEMVPQ